MKKERRPKQFDVSLVQGSEKEEREEWKERRAGHGRGLNNFTDSSPGNQRPTKKDAEE